ncbi:hypothetical protein [Pseudomonas serbica]|uniref:hypothetical protein n=1 Tax=Pseudomonas serbica TaxID=2965074 RepID=UPI00237A6844|nr:hypothetical protein [Pseudomonas serbica]
MKAEEKFNRKTAALLECQQPVVDSGGGLALGVRVRVFELPGREAKTLSLHLTPDEALRLAEDLVREARNHIASGA